MNITIKMLFHSLKMIEQGINVEFHMERAARLAGRIINPSYRDL